jgi:hypothetical protein
MILTSTVGKLNREFIKGERQYFFCECAGSCDRHAWSLTIQLIPDQLRTVSINCKVANPPKDIRTGSIV